MFRFINFFYAALIITIVGGAFSFLILQRCEKIIADDSFSDSKLYAIESFKH